MEGDARDKYIQLTIVGFSCAKRPCDARTRLFSGSFTPSLRPSGEINDICKVQIRKKFQFLGEPAIE